MNEGGGTKQPRKSNEITIAVIGLVGVLVTALLSNWDRLFPDKKVVTAKFTGYHPTGDPKIEFRYFFDLVGLKDIIMAQTKAHWERRKEEWISESPGDNELIQQYEGVYEELVSVFYEQALDAFIQHAAKYYSIEQIQELNKFESTPVMREFHRLSPLLLKDWMPVALELAEKQDSKMQLKFNELEEKWEAKRDLQEQENCEELEELEEDLWICTKRKDDPKQ